MTECPYCGSGEGYYITETARRNRYYTFDDKPSRPNKESVVCDEEMKLCISCSRVLPRKKGR